MTTDRLAMMLPLTPERKEFVNKYSELYGVEPWEFVVFCVDVLMDMDDDTVFDDYLVKTMKSHLTNKNHSQYRKIL